MATLIAVRFTFPQWLAPEARQVAVVSSFNGWDPRAHQLSKTHEGDWRITVFLPPGRIIYCFSVDGMPWLDPCDDERVPNGWGSEYSVRYVRNAQIRGEQHADGQPE